MLSKLQLENTNTKLLAIVGNKRGAEDASEFSEINYLGYPFSISETFQMRNLNSTIADSVIRLDEIMEVASKHNKQMVVYVSMGFGNPYGDVWSAEVAEQWVDVLVKKGVTIISLADTIGIATPESISYLFSHLISKFPQIEFGAHLHTTPESWLEKIDAAYNSGCLRFDGAIKGYGGCPMAADDLTGNMATENILQYFEHKHAQTGINKSAFRESVRMALKVFSE